MTSIVAPFIIFFLAILVLKLVKPSKNENINKTIYNSSIQEKATTSVEITEKSFSGTNNKSAFVTKDDHIYDNIDFSLWKNENLNFLNKSHSLSDIIIFKDLNQIFYGDLLSCFEWKYKRLIILLRDKYKCTDCSAISKHHHVHHTYYLQDQLPWDIENVSLETLCPGCHRKRHERMKIPVFKISNGIKKEISNEKPICSRCGGIGYISEFSHVQNGICFKCKGNSISQSVYFKVVNETYKNLNSYNDENKREAYRRFIMNLSPDEIIKSVPDVNQYIKMNELKTSKMNNYDFDEDLPF